MNTMEKAVWEYIIKHERQILKIPYGAELLTCQAQNGTIYIWFLVNPDHEPIERTFVCFPTNIPISYENGADYKYIASLQTHRTEPTLHLFETIDAISGIIIFDHETDQY